MTHKEHSAKEEEEEANMGQVKITRGKLYGSGGRPMGRFAWKWYYTVHGAERHSTETLFQARAIAKRVYGDRAPILTWKVRS